jgi:hypothetical protein
VEKFNDVYDKLFFRPQQFKSLARLRAELLGFENFHNRSHRYAKLAQRTPWPVHSKFPPSAAEVLCSSPQATSLA